ncbi:dapper homolog 3 isoform X1 [Etheostoma cragini]|uniref:dapper homolog 3 isoform X1 n=1 Tax=Etheostoma cragini TaxID=417921 RepID=UPI00155E8E0F|nr:dapper homolog 3 isoform X1 [Etheostoma cragini]
MHRALSFPVTVERSRTKERLEASLAGLCELELRKQRQECLVLGALALGDPQLQDCSRGELACFSSWGQENLTLRRQLSALQSSPWGLMQALEQQVGDLRIDTDEGCSDAEYTGNSRPSSGFYESSEGQSHTGRSCSTEPTETVSSWGSTNNRPKSVGDPLMLNGELDAPVPRTTLPRSFSAPYPPLEGIAEEGAAVDSWQWDPSGANQPWQQQPAEDQVTEEDYQQALRVEGYILSLIQRHTLASRPCQPRTTLSPDPPYCSASGHSSLQRRTQSLTTEQHFMDPHLQPHVDLSANPKSQGWGCDLLEGEACRGEAPSLEEDYYLVLPYPQSRPHSLAERLPSPLSSLDPSCGVGALDPCCEPPSPQHYLPPNPAIHHKNNLVSAQYIPGQAFHAPVRTPRHYNSEQPKPTQAVTSPDHQNSKSRTSKKTHNERQRTKKSSSKTSRSQSENSLLGQRLLPERRYSTTERHQGRGDLAQNQNQVNELQICHNSHKESRRWCSNLELSQDEGETIAGQSHRRPRKARHGHFCPHSQPQNYQQQQHPPCWHPDFQERAPLCQGEEGYTGAAPAESESSMSEVYSPASSSLSSDSDESGGLVWPQQLPPRLASTSSSSSPSPQATANAPSQSKAVVKIKASHALKKKILRFRSGSLKVMTTV